MPSMAWYCQRCKRTLTWVELERPQSLRGPLAQGYQLLVWMSQTLSNANNLHVSEWLIAIESRSDKSEITLRKTNLSFTMFVFSCIFEDLKNQCTTMPGNVIKQYLFMTRWKQSALTSVFPFLKDYKQQIVILLMEHHICILDIKMPHHVWFN